MGRRPTGERPAGPYPRGSGLNATSEVAEIQLPPEPSSVARARAFVLEAAEPSTDRVAQHVELLASEVATNAVLHARTAFTMRVGRRDGTIRVEAEDGNSALPRRKRYGPTAAVGRGLLLIERIADRWGVRPEPDGKVVWFEIDDGAAVGD